jgi:hypothetical protein
MLFWGSCADVVDIDFQRLGLKSDRKEGGGTLGDSYNCCCWLVCRCG